VPKKCYFSLFPSEQAAATRLELIQSASHEASRLNRLIGNLLDMTRLEVEELRLHREPVDLLDLIVTATKELTE
jgi:K+-sensing histidine kinase KdpD